MTRPIKFRACPVLSEFYIVGTDGHVYGERGQLKEWKDRDGYPHVYLVRGKQRCYRAVHKLILSAWFPKPTEKHQVNHKNGVRNDNRLENLEWVTSRENTIHGWKRGRVVSEKHRANGRKQMAAINKIKWHNHAKAA